MTDSQIKETLKVKLKKTFIKNGFVNLRYFIVIGDDITVNVVPDHMLESTQSKMALMHALKLTVKQYNARAAGFLSTSSMISGTDEEIEDFVKSGIDPSESKLKKDIIMISFQTPETDELHGYIVDKRRKKILSQIFDGKTDESSGTFSGIFS